MGITVTVHNKNITTRTQDARITIIFGTWYYNMSALIITQHIFDAQSAVSLSVEYRSSYWIIFWSRFTGGFFCLSVSSSHCVLKAREWVELVFLEMLKIINSFFPCKIPILPIFNPVTFNNPPPHPWIWFSFRSTWLPRSQPLGFGIQDSCFQNKSITHSESDIPLKGTRAVVQKYAVQHLHLVDNELCTHTGHYRLKTYSVKHQLWKTIQSNVLRTSELWIYI